MLFKNSCLASIVAISGLLTAPNIALAKDIESYKDYQDYCSPAAYQYGIQSSDCDRYRSIYENRFQEDSEQRQIRRREATEKSDTNQSNRIKGYVGGSLGAFFPTEDVELIQFDENEIIENFIESELGIPIEELESDLGLSVEELDPEFRNFIIESELGLSELGLSADDLREISKIDLDTGFGGSLFAGAKFNKNFATDLEFMLTGGGTEFDEVGYSQWGIFLNPKFILPLSKKENSVAIFLSPGLGISKGKINYDLTDADAEALGTEEGLSISLEDDLSFAWQVKLGLSVPFSNRYSGFTQVRYVNPTGENTIDLFSTEVGLTIEF